MLSVVVVVDDDDVVAATAVVDDGVAAIWAAGDEMKIADSSGSQYSKNLLISIKEYSETKAAWC